MTLTALPPHVISPLLSIPLMCIVIGNKIYFTRAESSNSSDGNNQSVENQNNQQSVQSVQSVQNNVDQEFTRILNEAQENRQIECIQRESPGHGLQSIEMNLQQFNQLKKRVVSEESSTSKVLHTTNTLVAGTLSLTNHPIIPVVLSALGVAFSISMLQKMLNKRNKKYKKAKKMAQIAALVDSGLYRTYIPEVIFVESANDVVLPTIDSINLNSNDNTEENINALLACKLKMNLMQSRGISNEVMYKFVKENPFMLYAYYVNCINETSVIAQKFLNATASPPNQLQLPSTSSASGNVTIEEVRDIEDELHQSLNRIHLVGSHLSSLHSTTTGMGTVPVDQPTLDQPTLDRADSSLVSNRRRQRTQSIQTLDRVNRGLSAESNQSTESARNSVLWMPTPFHLFTDEITPASETTAEIPPSSTQIPNLNQELKNDIDQMLHRLNTLPLIDLDSNTDLINPNPNNQVSTEYGSSLPFLNNGKRCLPYSLYSDFCMNSPQRLILPSAIGLPIWESPAYCLYIHPKGKKILKYLFIFFKLRFAPSLDFKMK